MILWVDQFVLLFKSFFFFIFSFFHFFIFSFFHFFIFSFFHFFIFSHPLFLSFLSLSLSLSLRLIPTSTKMARLILFILQKMDEVPFPPPLSFPSSSLFHSLSSPLPFSFFFFRSQIVENPYIMVICQTEISTESKNRPDFSLLKTLHRVLPDK